MPTSARVGLQQAAHAGEQLGVQRFGVEAQRAHRHLGAARSWTGFGTAVQRSCLALQELLEDQRRAPRRHRWRPARSLRPWCSARRPRAPAAESARAAGARRPWRGACCRAARRRDGWARPPPAHRAATAPPVARWPASAHRPSPTPWSAAAPCLSIELPTATPTRRVPKSKARNESGRSASHRRGCAHACPASWLSMRGSMPSSDSALS